MRYLVIALLALAACVETSTPILAIDNVAIRDHACGDPEAGCVVLAPRDGVVVLPVSDKSPDLVDVYVFSTGELATEFRFNGEPVAATVTSDPDGTGATLAVPEALLEGTITIEMADDRFTFELLRSIAGPNTTVPSGCTCNSTLHKVYCPVLGKTYTYCSTCCGY